MNHPLSATQLQHGYELINQLTVSHTLSLKFLILATGGFFLFLPVFITIYVLPSSNMVNSGISLFDSVCQCFSIE